MKKYGQAEFMIYLVNQFIDRNCAHLTEEQREKIKQESHKRIFEKYPSVRELELAA